MGVAQSKQLQPALRFNPRYGSTYCFPTSRETNYVPIILPSYNDSTNNNRKDILIFWDEP